MTGNAGTRTGSSSIFTEHDRADLRKRMLRRRQILEGALPTSFELLTGLPLCSDDLQADVMTYIDNWKAKSSERGEQDLLIAAELARVEASFANLCTLGEAVTVHCLRNDIDFPKRVQIWLAYLGDRRAIEHVSADAARPRTGWRGGLTTAVYRICFSVGITSRRSGEVYEAGDADLVMLEGMKHVSSLTAYVEALEATAEVEIGKSLPSGLVQLVASFDEEEQQGETASKSSGLASDLPGRGEMGVVVVPNLPEGATGAARELRKSWQGIAGNQLPLVTCGDAAGHRQALVSRWPHAQVIVDVVLNDLTGRETARFRPTLVLGNPGSGKSSLVRAICEQVGLPTQLIPMAGLSDSSMMGTSAQWYTARENAPLQLIKSSKSASVALIWDEIEKAADSRNNGNAIEALLPMLEIDQARKYRDLALEVEVDLSEVSHFATANSLDAIPAPVRDRFRILQMPDPGWQHLPVLTRQIIDRLAGERGVDVRWYGSLAEDELELIRRAWRGGSIRKLTAVVRTIIDGRDRLMGKC